MNAQLGAMVALGDLQRYTGPDQRVTARADILTAPGMSGSGPAGQQKWTGVWSSKEITNDPLDQDDGLNNRQPRWMVSGNDLSLTALDPSTSLPVTVDLATLGGSVTDKSNINQDDTVKAPKVEILGENNVPEGHYAYWVSDEGVKARVNMADPFLDSGAYNPNDPYSDEAYYRTAMAQVADPTAVTNSDGDQLLTGTNSRWKDETQYPDKISSLKNIPMFTGDNLPSDEFFHDFTVHSSGVLANTKDGGLKRDLSTALLNLPSDMRGPMFEPAGGSVALGDPGGPKWEQLADYFSLAGSGSGDQIDFRMPTPDQVGVSPVVTRFNYVVQVFAERLSTAPPQSASYIDQVTDYNYYVGMFPLITLWNPYDKPMSFPDLGLQFDMRGIVLREKLAGGDLVGQILPRNSIGQVKDQGWRRMIGMTIGGGIIPAGTAVNYTPPINSTISLTDASKNVLKQGASDKMIRGFFYGPTNIASAAVFPKARFPDGQGKPFFIDNNGNPTLSGRPIPFGGSRDVGKNGDEIKSNNTISTNFDTTGGGHWSTVINLYASPSLDKEERFFTLTGHGFGKIYFFLTKNTNNSGALNKLPRVIVLNDLGASSSTISGVGTSVSANYDDYSDFDLQEINQLAGGLANIVAIKNFPKLVPGTDKEEPVRGINLLSQFNPRATKSYRQVHMEEAKKDAGNKGAWKETNMGYVQYASGPYTQWMPDMYKNWVGGTDDQYSGIGLGNSSNTYGSDKMVLFEAPSRPPVSIGQLMHANLLNTSEISTQFDSVAGWTTNHQQVHTAPAYAIGNSIANVHLPLTETRVSLAQDGSKIVTATKPDGGESDMFIEDSLTWKHDSGRMKGSIYDYSYELNNALWDEYFLSGLDPGNIEFPLPDSQIKRRPISEGSDADAQESELKDERLAAAHLMLDGAFNINSTSVAAWESILGAMRDIYTLGGGVSEDDQLHNYSRFVSPIMESAISSDPETGGSLISYSSSNDRKAITAGYRSLTDKEIAMLAEKLVDEIRRRSSVKEHPFLSLSSFINRSIDKEDFTGPAARKRFMYTGALQSAIDQSGLNGRAPFDAMGELQDDNDGLWEDGYVYEPYLGATPTASSAYFPYLEDSVAAIEDRPLMEGAPGFLTQADVLSKIGGKLNARSDTFMIRSYGNSTGPFTESSEAESYFELVVQRVPEYLDSSEDTPDTEPDSLDARNKDFGRRYEIVSQRWINKGDI